MTVASAVPFTFRRSSDLYTSGGGYESTTETAQGLVRLERDRLVVQWRLAVRTEATKGDSYETREQIEPVREIAIPLDRVAGAFVTEGWWTKLAGQGWSSQPLIFSHSRRLPVSKASASSIHRSWFCVSSGPTA